VREVNNGGGSKEGKGVNNEGGAAQCWGSKGSEVKWILRNG
jgi:hypothetical protein